MSDKDLIEIIEVPGMLHAEMLRGLLEAEEIPVELLSQEGAGRAMGLFVGEMGAVHVLVRASDYERSLEVLEIYSASLRAAAEEARDEDGEIASEDSEPQGNSDDL